MLSEGVFLCAVASASKREICSASNPTAPTVRSQGRPYMQEQESSNVSIGCAITINVGSYTASFTALHASRASARHAGSLASASRVQLPVI